MHQNKDLQANSNNHQLGPAADGYGYAPYASDPKASKGRRIAEKLQHIRSEFQRDRERILHLRAFRRLQRKTQVFIAAEDDHYRTRLTHSLEVAQIARALARALRLNEDLAETIALAHDLGHPPFGHSGEEALNELMQDYGGFDHNAQALYIVTKGEERYFTFKGLNLTWESLEGIAKHNGPLKGAFKTSRGQLSPLIADIDKEYSLDLDKFASLEAQCAAIADDIAYNAHDIDDGLRAGILELKMLEQVELTHNILAEIKKTHPVGKERHYGYELARRQISLMIEDVVKSAQEKLATYKPKSVVDIYNAPYSFINFSQQLQRQEKELKKFLTKHLYKHESLAARSARAQNIIKELFISYRKNIRLLPIELYDAIKGQEESTATHILCNFLAGMTDNYAQQEYQRLKRL